MLALKYVLLSVNTYNVRDQIYSTYAADVSKDKSTALKVYRKELS